MNYYLGVDGGGSKTLAVVADETGRILGRGISGCGNHQ
ncbi:ATPase, partial [Paenibacillus tundrae]|nr:ATPase [Paenibacillus tundrae]